MTNIQKLISKECDEIKHMLLDKNRKYGNSAIEPFCIFSKLSPIEGINIRLDDKLKRIKMGNENDTEDSELDLIGYLIIKRVCKNYENIRSKMPDANDVSGNYPNKEY